MSQRNIIKSLSKGALAAYDKSIDSGNDPVYALLNAIDFEYNRVVTELKALMIRCKLDGNLVDEEVEEFNSYFKEIESKVEEYKNKIKEIKSRLSNVEEKNT